MAASASQQPHKFQFVAKKEIPLQYHLVMPQSHLLYGGRTVVVELQNRVIPAVAVEIPVIPAVAGEFVCFTGLRGGSSIIARSYNFFHFYVRRRN